MHEIVKTTKVDNPVCEITGSSNNAFENLSISVKKNLYLVAEQLTQDTNMSDIIDSINVSVLT